MSKHSHGTVTPDAEKYNREYGHAEFLTLTIIMTATIPSPESIAAVIEQAFQLAVAQHQAGQMQEAERLYRDILHTQPDHADASHNLGVLAVQMQQPEAGLPFLLAALEINPAQGQYWLSYIDALFQAGQLETARQVLAHAKQQGLSGDEADALEKRLAGDEQSALQVNAASQLARDKVGPALAGSQNCKGKVAKPDSPAMLKEKSPSAKEINKLMSMLREGRLSDALASAQSMTIRFPLHGFGWKVLGALVKQMGRPEEALVCMQKAAALSPDDAEAHGNFGGILKSMGRLDEAEASYRRALQIKPDFLEAQFDIGNILVLLGRLTEAKASFLRVLEINPEYIEGYITLSNLLTGTVEAELFCRQAIQIKPDFYNAHLSLGNNLLDMGRLEEAEASYRRAIQINPDNCAAYSNMLFCLSNNGDLDAQALFAEHIRFGEQFETPHRANWPQHVNSPNPERCLQVGIVSGDLRNHAVATFIEPVLAHLSGYAQLSLHAYSNHTIEDSITQRIRAHFLHWHSIVGLDDVALAEKIRGDGIDVLIDFSGHTGFNRLLTFARKPAPVQASWIGYPGTTGLQAMDYYLADRYLLPPGQLDDQFTEKIARLPANAPFMPSQYSPPVNVLPALSNGYVTFGSFNRITKIRRPVVALWAQLLRALPDSRMVLGGMPKEGGYDALLAWFSEEGIAHERLSFYTHCGMDFYLGLHTQVDICLDTFPYNGGTTTLHALWMGVPTLTLVGNTMPGRVGACVLGHAGLDEFMVQDKSEFVAKGLYWAEHLPLLAEVRAGLRERFEQSPMRRPEVIAAGLERALRTMWQRWCAGLPPESFEAIRQDEIIAMLEQGK